MTNRPPVAVSQSVNGRRQDSSVAITLQASDPDGNPLSYSYRQPSHGARHRRLLRMSLISPPPSTMDRTASTFTVDDGRCASASASVSITVRPFPGNRVNRMPLTRA